MNEFSKMQCPVCNSSCIKKVHDRVWSDEEKRVYQCEECHLGFLSPMMTESEEASFYAAYNEHAKKRGVITTTDSMEFHKKSIPEATKRWNKLGPHFRQGCKVLEVGSSTGAFLEICSQFCECSCVEPDAANREFASRFSIEQYGYIEDIPLSTKFDVICLFHVFEHIREPSLFLDKCNALLNPGGKIIIEVPHIEDPLLTIYDLEAYKDFYFQPMHHYIYSAASLKCLFERNGFLNGNIIYLQRYGLDNHLAWLKNGKPGGSEKYSNLFNDCKQYSTVLEKAGKTDTIIFIATK